VVSSQHSRAAWERLPLHHSAETPRYRSEEKRDDGEKAEKESQTTAERERERDETGLLTVLIE
jgi:hypothetical protein